MRRRRPRNLAEGAFFDAATAAGFDVCKRGWPDFIIEKGGKLYAVEVKPDNDHGLRRDQTRVIHWLASYGVPCLIWRPGSGFTPASALEPLPVLASQQRERARVDGAPGRPATEEAFAAL